MNILVNENLILDNKVLMKSWYVLVVRPNWELRVAKSLEQKDVDFFVPIITEKRNWSDRIKNIKVPLIRGYAFVQIEEKLRANLFDVPGVIRYLYVGGVIAKIRHDEVIRLKHSIENANRIVVENLIKPGDSYVIESGHFKGALAIVGEVRKHQIKLILKELGISIIVEKMTPVYVTG